MIDRTKLRNVIDHALHQGQGESKPSVDAVIGWVDAEGVEVPDPRIARIEALCTQHAAGSGWKLASLIREVLR